MKNLTLKKITLHVIILKIRNDKKDKANVKEMPKMNRMEMQKWKMIQKIQEHDKMIKTMTRKCQTMNQMETAKVKMMKISENDKIIKKMWMKCKKNEPHGTCKLENYENTRRDKMIKQMTRKCNKITKWNMPNWKNY